MRGNCSGNGCGARRKLRGRSGFARAGGQAGRAVARGMLAGQPQGLHECGLGLRGGVLGAAQVHAGVGRPAAPASAAACSSCPRSPCAAPVRWRLRQPPARCALLLQHLAGPPPPAVQALRACVATSSSSPASSMRRCRTGPPRSSGLVPAGPRWLAHAVLGSDQVTVGRPGLAHRSLGGRQAQATGWRGDSIGHQRNRPLPHGPLGLLPFQHVGMATRIGAHRVIGPSPIGRPAPVAGWRVPGPTTPAAGPSSRPPAADGALPAKDKRVSKLTPCAISLSGSVRILRAPSRKLSVALQICHVDHAVRANRHTWRRSTP
jgi:hypothetical protein